MTPTHRPALGDPCPSVHCPGTLGVYRTTIQGDYRIRYLACKRCGFKPDQNKWVIPLEYAPPQPPRGDQ